MGQFYSAGSKAQGGDDLIDADNFVSADKVYLYGGRGNDTLYASRADTNRLYGEESADVLHGGGPATYHYGGPGNDTAAYLRTQFVLLACILPRIESSIEVG